MFAFGLVVGVCKLFGETCIKWSKMVSLVYDGRVAVQALVSGFHAYYSGQSFLFLPHQIEMNANLSGSTKVKIHKTTTKEQQRRTLHWSESEFNANNPISVER